MGYDLFFGQPSPRDLGPHHYKPGLMRGLPDIFLMSELQFAAALICRKTLACTLVKNTKE